MSGNAFDAFDFTMEEAEEALKVAEQKIHAKDSSICLCGHASGNHSMVAGNSVCSANKQSCKCKKKRPVIEVDNARGFLRKTLGAGSLHALSQGMVAAIKAGQTIKWLVELKCDRCGEEGQVSPAPVNERGNIMDYSTGYDALLCKKCREEL